MATLPYAISRAHCTPVSIAQGRKGLGTMWGWETAQETLVSAGFDRIERNTLPHDLGEIRHGIRYFRSGQNALFLQYRKGFPEPALFEQVVALRQDDTAARLHHSQKLAKSRFAFREVRHDTDTYQSIVDIVGIGQWQLLDVDMRKIAVNALFTRYFKGTCRYVHAVDHPEAGRGKRSSAQARTASRVDDHRIGRQFGPQTLGHPVRCLVLPLLPECLIVVFRPVVVVVGDNLTVLWLVAQSSVIRCIVRIRASRVQHCA